MCVLVKCWVSQSIHQEQCQVCISYALCLQYASDVCFCPRTFFDYWVESVVVRWVSKLTLLTRIIYGCVSPRCPFGVRCRGLSTSLPCAG